MVFTAGKIIGFQYLQTYDINPYSRFAVSVVGASTALRLLAGFGFLLFAPYIV